MNIEKFKKIKEKQEILKEKNARVFSDDYIPMEIYYRDDEISKIDYNIRRAENLLIIGDVGTGKTLCIKWLFNIYEKEDENLFPIYHNCRNSTMSDLFNSIMVRLNLKYRKKQTAMNYIQDINSITLKMEKKVIICLDEINHLIARYKDPDLLYSFVDPAIIKNISLILISNTSDWHDDTSKKTKDRLQANVLKFDNYNLEQIRGILEQRISIGINNGIVTLEEIKQLAEILNSENHTIRDGIKILSRIYDYKKFRELKLPLDKKSITNFISQVINEGYISRYLILKNNLQICVYCFTKLFYNTNKKHATVEDILQCWNKNAEKSNTLTPKSHQSIRNYINELITYGFIIRQSISRGGFVGYNYGYKPLFNVEEFMIYFQTEYMK